MGTIKERNGMDIKEAKDIKKWWQDCTKEPYKKTFMTQIIIMVLSLTWSQISWYVKSSGP